MRREGGKAERVGQAPTHLDEIIQADFAGNWLVMMGGYGGGEFVREVPILSQVSAGGAVVDLEQVPFGLEQVEAEVVGNLQHAGVFFGICRHHPQRA